MSIKILKDQMEENAAFQPCEREGLDVYQVTIVTGRGSSYCLSM